MIVNSSRHTLLSLFIFTLSFSQQLLAAESKSLTVISWNVKHLGRANLDAQAVASLLTAADIVTFQEVNKSDSGQGALKLVAARIKEKVSEKICWGLSEIPSGSQERYAYLWRQARISYVKTDGTIMENCPESALTIRLADKNAAKIVREPAEGTFYAKAAQRHFTLASIHLVPSGKGPQHEVAPLFDTFQLSAAPMIVAGDYNLDSAHPAFKSARDFGFVPALVGVKTSLKMKQRILNKPYDNFWFKGFLLKGFQVINLYDAFPAVPARDIYKNISDHCPVTAVFDFL